MTVFEKCRHTLEQKLLPQMFAQEKANMLNSILDKEGKFFVDVLAVYMGAVDGGYKPDGFKVYLQRAKSEDKFFDFVVVKLPPSDEMSLADTLYFCLEETTGESAYFFAQPALGGERALMETDGSELTPHGKLSDDADKEFQQAANIFIRRVHGMAG